MTEGPRAAGPAEGAVVLVDGLEDFGLVELESAVVSAVLAALEGQALTAAREAEVSVTFLDDPAIARMNEEWLGREGPTDVLSFELGRSPLVADVYVSVDTARANAKRFDVATREELLRLVVHGVLHAAGYDHPEGGDRARSPMFELQERLLARLLGGLAES